MKPAPFLAYPTPFRQVSEMNTAFGNAFGCDAVDPWGALERQRLNMLGELSELEKAIEEKDLTAARDALCDVMVFALGTYHRLGLPYADADMAEVVRALYTRFARDEEHLVASVAHYVSKGLKVTWDGEFPRKVVRSAVDQHDIHGERYTAGKFLKALGYEQPQLRPAG